MWCPLALVLPVVLRGTPELPYVVENGLNILIDSGASATYLRQTVIDAGGPIARLAGGAESVEATAPLQLPADVGGILGFDALGAAASCELDLRGPCALRLDEAAHDDGAATTTVTVTATTRGVGVSLYGLSPPRAGRRVCAAAVPGSARRGRTRRSRARSTATRSARSPQSSTRARR